jgi:hypothetical protein
VHWLLIAVFQPRNCDSVMPYFASTTLQVSPLLTKYHALHLEVIPVTVGPGGAGYVVEAEVAVVVAALITTEDELDTFVRLAVVVVVEPVLVLVIVGVEEVDPFVPVTVVVLEELRVMVEVEVLTTVDPVEVVVDTALGVVDVDMVVLVLVLVLVFEVEVEVELVVFEVELEDELELEPELPEPDEPDPDENAAARDWSEVSRSRAQVIVPPMQRLLA